MGSKCEMVMAKIKHTSYNSNSQCFEMLLSSDILIASFLSSFLYLLYPTPSILLKVIHLASPPQPHPGIPRLRAYIQHLSMP